MRRALYRLLGLFGLTVKVSVDVTEVVRDGFVYRERVPGSVRRRIVRLK